MIALWREWRGDGSSLDPRIAASLGLFAGRPASFFRAGNTAFCDLPVPRLAHPVRGWRPHIGSDGSAILFDGWLDDRIELAAALEVSADDHAALYGAAVAKWGDDADARLNGNYAAIVATPNGEVRLSRSPWSAPPLHYANDESRAIVASVPRVLLSAGVAATLDPTKVADNLLWNHSDEERGWYRGTFYVPQGSIAHLAPGRRQIVRWYDPHLAPRVRLPRDEDYVDAAAELLRRATAHALADVKNPGISLSGGLDSSLVASEVLRQLAPGGRLKSFTFRPIEAWDGRLPADLLGDEKPFVDAFAAMYPALDPHFTRNEDGGFDHRWREMFLAMGIAPSFFSNYYVYHGVWEGARDAGCDWLFDAALGNQTLSNDGRWSYVEHLKTLKWRQLYKTLAHRRGDPRPVWRKLLSLSLLPLAPQSWRDPVRRLRHPRLRTLNEMAGMIHPGFSKRMCAEQRARAMGAWRDVTYVRSRREAIADDYAREGCEGADVLQAFEQIYGVRRRDVLAYRPLIEFCLGLPTEQYVRDGEERWLAKRLARGRLPEEQRLNPRYGRHDVDWHARLSVRRGEMIAEVERIAKDPHLSEIIDTDRIRQVLDNWPEETPVAPEDVVPPEAGVTRAILAARFINFAEGRNDI